VGVNVRVTFQGRPVAVVVEVATFGHPGRFDPYDGGDPPEGPEGEVTSASFADGAEEPIDLAALSEAAHEELLGLALDAAWEEHVNGEQDAPPPACGFCDGMGCNGCAKGHTEAGAGS